MQTDISFIPAPPVSAFERSFLIVTALCIGFSYILGYFAPVTPPEERRRLQSPSASIETITPKTETTETTETETPEITVEKTPQKRAPQPAINRQNAFSSFAPSLAVFPSESFDYKDLDTLIDALESARYGKQTMPRQFLVRFPAAFADTQPSAIRKAAFFSVILPLILKTNESILKKRERLLSIQAEQTYSDYPLSVSDRYWLGQLAARYGLETININALLERVDVIPVSVAMAQAALESAWGRSRFARQGNALFGQWTFNQQAGLKPLQREAGKNHVVKHFPTLIDSVRSYARNLNTHAAYREFRAKRAELRAANKEIDGLALVDRLQRYSERGYSYIRDVKALMNADNLTAYDNARLSPARLAARID